MKKLLLSILFLGLCLTPVMAETVTENIATPKTVTSNLEEVQNTTPEYSFKDIKKATRKVVYPQDLVKANFVQETTRILPNGKTRKVLEKGTIWLQKKKYRIQTYVPRQREYLFNGTKTFYKENEKWVALGNGAMILWYLDLDAPFFKKAFKKEKKQGKKQFLNTSDQNESSITINDDNLITHIELRQHKKQIAYDLKYVQKDELNLVSELKCESPDLVCKITFTGHEFMVSANDSLFNPEKVKTEGVHDEE